MEKGKVSMACACRRLGRFGAIAAVVIAATTFSTAALAQLTYYTSRTAFEAAAPGLSTEDFESTGTFDPTEHYIICSDPYDFQTSDNCWTPGDVLPGVTIGSGNGDSTVILGPEYYGTPSIVTGSNTMSEATEIGFPFETFAAGMDLVSGALEDFDISVYGADDLPLGYTTAQGSPAGLFFGVISTQPIKRIQLVSNNDTLIDNLSFEALDLGTLADMSIAMTGVEGPTGTFTYTVTVSNLGPSTATGIAASVTIPSGLAYASNDCGAAPGSSPWIWNVASLASGNTLVCHLVTTTGVPGGDILVNANVATSGTFDFNSANNSVSAYGPSADVAIALTGVEGPADTFTYTVTASNLGPNTALGVKTTISIPAGLAYSYSDCSAFVVSSTWIWDVASLANGNNEVCHFAVTVVDTRGAVLNATVTTSGTVDLVPGNNSATAYGPTADVAIAVTGVESPPGTMVYTVTVSNSGPRTALDTEAILHISLLSGLAYLSDDCGGSNSLSPWNWTIPTLISGSNVVCHVVASVVRPQGVYAYALFGTTGVIDTNNTNNEAIITNSPTGPGPDTPSEGIALYRSFYDLPFKDEVGASFSLRDNADKVILLQICTAWCGPCRGWTNQGAALKQAVDQSIGEGNFLDVDILVQNDLYGPSTQADAMDWKTSRFFPGPVLHSEGIYSSPVWALDNNRIAQYAAIPGETAFYPELYILAPGCDNQIAVRVNDNPEHLVLGEAAQVSLSTINQMANLITQVWNDRQCVKPVVHRLDRCSVGSAQIYSNLQSGDFAETAVPFNIPAGKNEAITSVMAVTDADVLDFAVYTDAAATPGSAVCTSTGRPASSVYASGVKRINLDPACKLGPGNYWLGLKGRSSVDTSFVPTWKGGVLPPTGSYYFHDSGDCPAWAPAGQCPGTPQNAQLCFVLDSDALFLDGFETSAP